MKKPLIIAIITAILLITGCNSQTKKLPEDLKGIRLEQQFSITSEDDEKYIGKIQFNNPTKYNFMPTEVYVQLQIRYLDNGTDTFKPNPIQLQAEEINLVNQEFEYKVEVPKKLFDVFERTDKENISVWIKGVFLKDERLILVHLQGDQARLMRE